MASPAKVEGPEPEGGRLNYWLKNVFKSEVEKFNPVVLSDEEYQLKATAAVKEAFRLLHEPGFKLEKKGTNEGDLVESLQVPELGKTFRFTGEVDCPAKFFYEYLRDRIAELPSWNPTVISTKTIKQMQSNVDLSHQITAGGGGGLVSARDFIVLRRIVPVTRDGIILRDDDHVVADGYIVAGVSVEYPGYPPTKQYVRAHTRVSSWYLQTIRDADGNDANRCVFQWIMNIDFAGSLPQFVLDAAYGTVMVDYIKYLRAFVEKERAAKSF